MSPLEAGAPLPPLHVAAVDPERMKAMAVLLQDPNPIHVDPASVRALGLGERTITQGPMSMGYVANALTAVAPGAVVQRLKLRFAANVFAGDGLTVTGTIDEVEVLDDGARLLRCSVALDVEGGARALEGTATVRVPAT